jgi:hypothetical protein
MPMIGDRSPFVDDIGHEGCLRCGGSAEQRGLVRRTHHTERGQSARQVLFHANSTAEVLAMTQWLGI